MRLTTKGRFAVTAMIDVAMHNGEGPVTLAGVADRQKISLSYLEQLFGKLRRHGLVDSVRGPGGGYNLARTANSTSVADRITACRARRPSPRRWSRGPRTRTSSNFGMTMKKPIYLDYSATTPVDPRVAAKMIPYLTEHFGNPASRSHAFGWKAEEAVEEARENVAALVNCD